MTEEPPEELLDLPEEIKKKVQEHIKQISDLEAQFNAYVSGLADANQVPTGWVFDKNRLCFYAPNLNAIDLVCTSGTTEEKVIE